MTRIVSRLLAATAGLALVTTLAPAQALPTAEQVRARYIEALGGEKAIRAQTGRHVLAMVEVPAQGIAAPIEIWSSPPNKVYTVTNIPGMGELTSGFDGETAWTNNPATGPLVLDGRALNQMKQQADFHGVLHPEKYVTSAEVTGEAKWEGKDCWVVKVKTTWDEEYTEYYDKATNLLHGMARSQESPMGPLEATTLFTEYKAFEGVLAATVVTVKVMGMEQIVRTEQIDVGVVPDSIFALPAAIKALKKP